MKTPLKIVLVFFLVLIGLAAAVLIYSYAAYPAEYVSRVLRWGNADVADYRKFPARSLEASPEPFRFDRLPEDDHVRRGFETVLADRAESAESAGTDWDAFLEENDTQAFLVIRDDAILYEGYFNGVKRDSVVTSFSVAKSFASALIGAAVADGYIGSVDDPITKYLPELADRDPAFGEITIRDLLRMSSGIRYKEFPFVNGDDAKTYYYPDLRRLALEETEIEDPPGESFHYNNYHPLLLGLILERVTGTPVASYLQERIWRPLGMEFPGSWSLDERGFEKLESGINGRAIDFAKFGRLYRDGGFWEGRQVIPTDWVAASIRRDPALERPGYYPDDFAPEGRGLFYGYLWWGIRRTDGSDDFAALGNHGQIIYVSPDSRIIVVRHGLSYGSYGDFSGWIDLIRDFAAAFP